MPSLKLERENLEKTQAIAARLVSAAALPDLDAAQKYLENFVRDADIWIYRGGSHIAILQDTGHAVKGERIAMIYEGDREHVRAPSRGGQAAAKQQAADRELAREINRQILRAGYRWECEFVGRGWFYCGGSRIGRTEATRRLENYRQAGDEREERMAENAARSCASEATIKTEREQASNYRALARTVARLPRQVAHQALAFVGLDEVAQ